MRKSLLFKIGEELFQISYSIFLLIKFRMHERLSSPDIKRYQQDRLKKILLNAYKDVPYYEMLFRRNRISLSDINCVEDISKIPILEKDYIRNKSHSFISKKAKQNSLTYLTTSGSSGTPTTIIYNNKEAVYNSMLVKYSFIRSGVPLFAKIARFNAEPYCQRNRILRFLDLIRQVDIDLRKGPEENIRELNQMKPDFMYGYPSYLALISKFILEKGLRLNFKPKIIFTNGEILTKQIRELLQMAFGCKIKNTYGSMEFFRIAIECEYNSLHIIPDSVILEVDKNETDENGASEAIITSLYHNTMPLIRYKIGDRVVLSDTKCKCGLESKIIREVIGRSDDYLVLPSGKKVSARAINLLQNIPGIKEYQIIQKKKDYIEVFVRASNTFSDDSIKLIKKVIISGCLGEDIQINVIKKDNIVRSSRGKLKAVISEVR